MKIFPEDVHPCDTSFIEVEVLYKATNLKYLTVEFQLPTGVTYVNGSFSITQNPDGIYNSTAPTGTINSPIFTIFPSGGSTAGLGDIIRFRFAKRVGCNAVGPLNSGALFKDIQIVDLTQGSSTVHHFSNLNPNVSNYQVLVPSLALQSIPDKDVIVGQTISRKITMVQGGKVG
ncbi:MAG TPA: hypothetical protein ENK91_16115 [Bacteroidetes bacterium]|nr:hypothetical protein [Bacteroidota bacterium]